jgi:UDP-glucuronate 4-epimerase
MNILVTGCSGFIGMHTCIQLLTDGNNVIGIDNMNEYYDLNLKKDRLLEIKKFPKFSFFEMDLNQTEDVERIFFRYSINIVIHLAAQAGVRYSLTHTQQYVDSNISGLISLLNICKRFNLKHFVFASSSSVYGLNSLMPCMEDHPTNHPVSLYAATKKSGELICHSYSHLYHIPISCLRFFTVYGPWGRPDMSPSLFADAITCGRPINVFNNGKMRRDFTYINDIVDGICRILALPPTKTADFDRSNPQQSSSSAPFSIFNIGNSHPVELLYFIALLEASLGKKAIFNLMPMQPGDVYETYASTDKLATQTLFAPTTPIEIGVEKFSKWFNSYRLNDK